jgi:hypothetical protein
MMKASLNGSFDLKRVTCEGINWLHERLESPSKQDIDAMLLAFATRSGGLLIASTDSMTDWPS